MGQIRLDVDRNKLAHVAVGLNPEFFGKHIGSKIIRMGTEIFRGENPSVIGVFAEIYSDNISSRKAFSKAGYVFKYCVIKKDGQIVVYEFGKN